MTRHRGVAGGKALRLERADVPAVVPMGNVNDGLGLVAASVTNEKVAAALLKPYLVRKASLPLRSNSVMARSTAAAVTSLRATQFSPSDGGVTTIGEPL